MPFFYQIFILKEKDLYITTYQKCVSNNCIKDTQNHTHTQNHTTRGCSSVLEQII